MDLVHLPRETFGQKGPALRSNFGVNRFRDFFRPENQIVERVLFGRINFAGRKKIAEAIYSKIASQ